METFAVLGAGAGGCALAADLALKGLAVRLFNRNEARLIPLRSQGGIRVRGAIRGIGRPRVISSNLGEVLDGSTIAVFCVPGYAQRELYESALPFLIEDHLVVFSPGSGGSLEAAAVYQNGKGRFVPLFVETVTLPYICRMEGPDIVRVSCRLRLRAAAFPAERTQEVLSRLRRYLDLVPGSHVLEVALQNPNPLIHPVPVLMNQGEIDRTQGRFALYGNGITDSVLRVVHKLDEERQELCAALDGKRATLDGIYAELGVGPLYRLSREGASTGVSEILGVPDRFLDEDVPYGLVFWASLGRHLGVPMPLTTAVVDLAAALRGCDFWKTGRTVENLRLQDLDRDGLLGYLRGGVRRHRN